MAKTRVKPLHRILSMLKYEKQEIYAIYFYAIMSSIVQLSLPLGIQSIISFVLGGSMSTSLVLLIILVVFGTFISGLLQVNQMKIIEKIQQQLYVRYAFLYTDILPKVNLQATEKYYLPELINRYFDVMTLQKGISKLLLDVPTAVIQIIVGLLLLSFYHPSFIFFGFFLILILVLIIYFTGNRGVETSLNESTNKYKLAAYLQQSARVVNSLKFINEKFHFKKSDKHISSYLDSRTAHFKILLVQYWTLISLKIVITAAMLIFGSVLLINQQLNIGQFIAAEIVIILVINSVEKLITNLDQVYDVITALEKINKVIELPQEDEGKVMLHNKKDTGLHISVNSVTLSYGKAGTVLKDVSFEVDKSTKLAVFGSSGSGKSSLLRLMSGVYKPDEGSVTINDTPVDKYHAVRKCMSVVYNKPEIFEGSMLDNMTLGVPHDYVEINNLIELVGLKEFVKQYKEGFDLELDAVYRHLSSEVLKKIALVRALLAKPRLLLLEYPFDNLPMEDTERVIRYIDEHMPNTTMVVITGKKEIVSLCDEVLVLEKGKVKLHGKTSELSDKL